MRIGSISTVICSLESRGQPNTLAMAARPLLKSDRASFVRKFRTRTECTNANTGSTCDCGKGQDCLQVYVLHSCRPPRSWTCRTSQGRYVDFEIRRRTGRANPLGNRSEERRVGKEC